jgi:hypothetical protein
MDKKLKQMVKNHSVTSASLRECFPQLPSHDVDVVLMILQGKIVGSSIVHNWSVGKNHVIKVYYGKVEGVVVQKGKERYEICCWEEGETYDEGEDERQPYVAIATDFIGGDLFFCVMNVALLNVVLLSL